MLLQLIPIVLLAILIYNFYWKRRKLPPGPVPLPIFGNTLEILFNQPGYDAYKKWHKQFGPIHTIWLGETPAVAMTDFDLIMETIQKDGETYAGRPNPIALKNLTKGGDYGVLNTQGEFWRDQRRFTLHVLRNFGLGKNLMQERVLAEVSALIEQLHIDLKKGAKEHDLATYIDIGVGSIINNILFGYRFEGKTEHEFYALKDRVNDLIKSSSHPLVLIMQNYIEMAKYFPLFSKHYYNLKNCRDKLFEFFRKQIEEHEKKVDFDSEPTDYVEAFLKEKAQKEAEGEGEFYSMPQLFGMLSDLWIAGQETTSNTTAWGLVYLMLDERIQDKLQHELDRVIGSDRMITMDDKPNLHYASAVVNEIQRTANLVPLNVRHTTTRDVTIRGYYLPEGTVILPQVSAVLYNEKIFPDYQKFDPDRFLDKNGKWKRVDELIPFSVGKRQCLGEGLARMELFLFIANLFNQFRIKQVSGKPLADPNVRKIGGTVKPETFVCNLIKRY